VLPPCCWQIEIVRMTDRVRHDDGTPPVYQGFGRLAGYYIPTAHLLAGLVLLRPKGCDRNERSLGRRSDQDRLVSEPPSRPVLRNTRGVSDVPKFFPGEKS